MFVCYMDFSKAFDMVNYWKLFKQLLGGINVSFVALLAFWYSNQCACVNWLNTQSDYFSIGNGTAKAG